MVTSCHPSKCGTSYERGPLLTPILAHFSISNFLSSPTGMFCIPHYITPASLFLIFFFVITNHRDGYTFLPSRSRRIQQQDNQLVQYSSHSQYLVERMMLSQKYNENHRTILFYLYSLLYVKLSICCIFSCTEEIFVGAFCYKNNAVRRGEDGRNVSVSECQLIPDTYYYRY